MAVAAGATPMRPVEVMPWGQTIAYVADINGFLVELCTPMA
jgi:lactoylglutathione lyase